MRQIIDIDPLSWPDRNVYWHIVSQAARVDGYDIDALVRFAVEKPVDWRAPKAKRPRR